MRFYPLIQLNRYCCFFFFFSFCLWMFPWVSPLCAWHGRTVPARGFRAWDKMPNPGCSVYGRILSIPCRFPCFFSPLLVRERSLCKVGWAFSQTWPSRARDLLFWAKMVSGKSVPTWLLFATGDFENIDLLPESSLFMSSPAFHTENIASLFVDF